MSSITIANCNDESNFPHTVLLTNRQVENLPKTLANNSVTTRAANIKLLKTQLCKLIQTGDFLGRLLWPLLKANLLLLKKVLQSLAKCVLISFWLTASASGEDAEFHKNIYASGRLSHLPHGERPQLCNRIRILVISNEKLEDIMKIGKTGSLIKVFFKKVNINKRKKS